MYIYTLSEMWIFMGNYIFYTIMGTFHGDREIRDNYEKSTALLMTDPTEARLSADFLNKTKAGL